MSIQRDKVKNGANYYICRGKWTLLDTLIFESSAPVKGAFPSNTTLLKRRRFLLPSQQRKGKDPQYPSKYWLLQEKVSVPVFYAKSDSEERGGRGRRRGTRSLSGGHYGGKEARSVPCDFGEIKSKGVAVSCTAHTSVRSSAFDLQTLHPVNFRFRPGLMVICFNSLFRCFAETFLRRYHVIIPE